MTTYSGTVLSAPIVVGTDLDNFPTHKSEFGKGGWHEVATTSERDAIPTERRTAGMAVYVINEAKIYILDANLTTWTEFSGGGSITVDQVYNASSTNAQAGVAVASAVSNVLPTQSGNNGKFLTTNGTTASWAAVPVATTYIHDQGVAANTWTIQHNLNKYPSVTIVDSSGNEIITDVTYTDLNNVTITMTAAFKGKAYLN